MAERDGMPVAAPARRVSLVRLRAGILVLLALGLISAMAGRWLATLLSLGLSWAAFIGIAVAVLVALLLSRLDRAAYFAVAGLITLLMAFGVYDFSRGPIDLSQGWALALAFVPTLLLAAAFWDFRKLMLEVRAWAAQRL